MLPNVFSLLKRHFTAEEVLLLEPGEIEITDDLLGSGTADATTFLRGDRTWAAPVAVVPDPLEVDEVELTTLRILEPGGPDFITLEAPALAASWTLTLPEDDGDPGEVLTTDGDGNTSWEAPSSGNEFQTLLLEDDDESQAITLQAPAVLAGSYTLTFPPDDGDAGELLQTNGSGVLDWILPSALHFQTLLLDDDDASNKVTIQAPSALSGDYTLTLPPNDGDANQVLVTDGSGGLSWQTVSTFFNHFQTLLLDDDDASQAITLQAPGTLSSSYTLTLPPDDGAADEFLFTDGSGGLDWASVDSKIAGFRDIFAWRHAGTTDLETWYTPSIMGEANVVATIQSNVLMAAPFVVTETMTLDRIAIHKNANGTAGARGTVGIYASKSRSNIYPDERIVAASEFALDNSVVNGAGVLAGTINVQLAPGLYWLAWNQDNTPAPPQSLSHDVSPSSLPTIGGVNPTTFATPRTHIRVAQTYDTSALPDPFPAGAALDGTQNMITIAVRVASYP